MGQVACLLPLRLPQLLAALPLPTTAVSGRVTAQGAACRSALGAGKFVGCGFVAAWGEKAGILAHGAVLVAT